MVRLEQFDYYNQKQNGVLIGYTWMENMDFLLPTAPSLVFARETCTPYCSGKGDSTIYYNKRSYPDYTYDHNKKNLRRAWDVLHVCGACVRAFSSLYVNLQ